MFAKRLLILGLLTALSLPTVARAGDYRTADIEECIQKLYSNLDEDRASAGERLSEMGAVAKAAVPRLTEILESDPKMSVRGEAAKALGNIGAGASSATPALIKFLQDKEGGLERAYAATALGNIGAQPDKAVPALIEVVQSDDQPVVKQLAARALGDFKQQASSAIPALIGAIQNGNKDLREAAADGLAKIPATAKNVPSLIALLGDEINSARLAAAKSLAGAGSEAAGAVEPLTKLLSDSDDSIKRACVQTLASIGKDARPAIPSLRLLAKDPSMKEQVEQAIADIKSAK